MEIKNNLYKTNVLFFFPAWLIWAETSWSRQMGFNKVLSVAIRTCSFRKRSSEQRAGRRWRGRCSQRSRSEEPLSSRRSFQYEEKQAARCSGPPAGTDANIPLNSSCRTVSFPPAAHHLHHLHQSCLQVVLTWGRAGRVWAELRTRCKMWCSLFGSVRPQDISVFYTFTPSTQDVFKGSVCFRLLLSESARRLIQRLWGAPGQNFSIPGKKFWKSMLGGSVWQR